MKRWRDIFITSMLLYKDFSSIIKQIGIVLYKKTCYNGSIENRNTLSFEEFGGNVI